MPGRKQEQRQQKRPEAGLSSYQVRSVDEVKACTVFKLDTGGRLRLRRSEADRNLVYLAETHNVPINVERQYDPEGTLYVSAIYCMGRKLYPIDISQRALGHE